MIKNTAVSINSNAKENAAAFIEECEKRFDEDLKAIVKNFLSVSEYDIVLLAGPSSSGKTTTAGKIVDEINKTGRNAFRVSLDDFYLDRDDIPVNPDGLKDYENVTALDIELIHKVFRQLIDERDAELPVFDFKTGTRSTVTNHIHLQKNDVIVVEGLHALNPVITEGLGEGHVYKIYISVSSRITDEGGKILLNKRNLRLIRRMVRDYHYRNSDVESTMKLWSGVLKGEDKYLFPFESYADVKLDSFHPYEPCLFKEEALSLLSGVEEQSPFFDKSAELITALRVFDSISRELIPEDSLLREFILI